MKSVTASAPGKLVLFGEHAVVYGYPCIVTAVNQRINATVRKNGIDIFHLEAPEMGLAAYSKTIADLGKKELPKSVRFIEMLYKRFLEKYPQKEGIVVTTKSDFSSSFGFGSSSAVTVAFAKALLSLYGIEVSRHELFNLCYQAVLDVQSVGSGFDLAAAIWGGTIYYVKPAKEVESIPVKNLPLVVGYTGIKADTPTLIHLVQKLKNDDPKRIDTLFQSVLLIVKKAKQTLCEEDLILLGDLMKQNQQLLSELKVSSVELDRLISASEKVGAYGAKLSGAGGGDCMIAIINESERFAVTQAITKSDGEVMNVELNAEGVRIES